ncbi:MAG: OmpA family protein [Reichenbachiella sp.]
MKSLFIVFILPIFFLFSGTLCAQSIHDEASDHKAFKKGERLFKNGNFIKAEEQFKILLDSGYRDNDLITLQAQVYLELHEPHSCKDVILLSEKRNEDLDYLLAISHYYLEEFGDALRELDLVKDTATYHVDDMRRRIKNSIEHYRDAEGYVVQNFGPEVNTKFREYSAVMYNDFNHLLYTSRNDSSEYADHDGLAYETIHGTTIDSLNNWHMADKFNFHMGHEKKHDATVQVYQEGMKLVTYHDGRLFTSHLVDGTWEEDGPLDIHGFDGFDTSCFLADDESFIIFASDFHSFGHNIDLYVSYKQPDSTWSEPEGIAELNTDYDEDAPFLAADSTLYFSSRGHGSLGGYDVFKSTYDKRRKKWRKPVNLDYPINTVAEDTYFSTYGKVGYVSSTRVGGYGSLDLYRVLLFNKIMIEGTLVDEETKEPIPYAQIELVYDSLYFRNYTDKEGKYEFFVPVNKEMKITFLKDGKVLNTDTYYADAFFREENNRGYNFQIPSEADAAKRAADKSAEPKFIHIDVQNKFEEDPHITAIANDEVSDWSDSLKNHYEERRIANAPPGPGMVTVYLDYNSSVLSTSAEDVLRALYNDILIHTKFKIEVSGHTDPVGSQGFNQRLSLKRAKVVAEFLFKQGLEKDNVEVVGHGEMKLIDKTNSEEANAKNRRVEIKFD